MQDESCPFTHDFADEDLDDSEPEAKEYICEKAGGLVSFGEGAAAMWLELPQNTAVQVTGIPDHYTKSMVADTLTLMGRYVVTHDNVLRLWRVPGRRGQCAVVQEGSADFAERICRKFHEKFACSSPMNIISVAGTMGDLSNPRHPVSRSVDCRKVVCSWERPSRWIRLVYCDKDKASKAYKGMDSGEYTVLGEHAKISLPYERLADPSRSWVIKLHDVPAMTTGQAQVREMLYKLPRALWPFKIEFGPLTHAFQESSAGNMIRGLLQGIGPVDDWEVSKSSDLRIIKGCAVFRKESEAREAARRLHNTAPFNTDQVLLSVKLMIQINFKILGRIYQTVLNQIHQQKEDWETAGITFAAEPPTNSPFRHMKLEGEDSGAMAKAQQQLQEILAGRLVCEPDGKIYQIPASASRQRISRGLKLVESLCSVVVQRDRLKRQVRIIGPAEDFEPAARILISLFDTCEEKQVTSQAPENTPHDPTNCQVCWTQPEAEEIIRTSCGHTYCQGCFAHLAHSAGTSTAKDFEIRCAAEGCGMIFPISEIQRHLSAEAFEQVLDASTASNIARNRFVEYCPTPDCGNIYISTATWETLPNGPIHTCCKCLQLVCTSCHVRHLDMTCEEYQETQADATKELQDAKKLLGVKDCPVCRVPIQKAGGCNHVVCERGCGKHICWVCLECFNTDDECYRHMWNTHNRIYDPEEIAAAEHNAAAEERAVAEQIVAAAEEMAVAEQIAAAAEEIRRRAAERREAALAEEREVRLTTTSNGLTWPVFCGFIRVTQYIFNGVVNGLEDLRLL
ncbi:hypothetical protein V8F20_008202 [Naviculisporaceae sp. PSN 640]